MSDCLVSQALTRLVRPSWYRSPYDLEVESRTGCTVCARNTLHPVQSRLLPPRCSAVVPERPPCQSVLLYHQPLQDQMTSARQIKTLYLLAKPEASIRARQSYTRTWYDASPWFPPSNRAYASPSELNSGSFPSRLALDEFCNARSFLDGRTAFDMPESSTQGVDQS